MTSTLPPRLADPADRHSAAGSTDRPWAALVALCVGFFLILVDMTIVSVATPAIITALDADVNQAVWVTSAYLLAYAVPVLITGRLGDRFGPRRIYLLGLAVFGAASLWCGLTTTVEMLIVARVAQGLGAAMMAPQTMAIITRIFPPVVRGRAMAVWGLTVGVSTLLGPLMGGVLVDALGWEWIFLVNIPLVAVALVLAVRLVPALETHSRDFDWGGVVLSGVGMFLLVFGIQEGHQQDWAPWIWAMILGGLVVLGAFVWWQWRNQREPLVPLTLFHDRNFSLGNAAIAVVGFAITAMAFPLMLYAQGVRGMSPTEAALLLVPMAVLAILLARRVGRLTDRVHPRLLIGFGFAVMAASFGWLSQVMTVDSHTWELLLATAGMGVGNAFIWAPNSTTTSRNLPEHQAGAGAGVYNATRQVGSVLGAAGIAVLMDGRLAAEGLDPSAAPESGLSQLPPEVVEGFAAAMSQSMLLPAVVLVLGLAVVACFERPRHDGFDA
ncbi:DHA2 family efflux MFS transporter permease subunit [Nocardioides soli]|uniref:EmrB/QacA subfamily drug resistance transporter n=1 Tax=Nocardioides soli TaxID=1036020 RepID=A0A7W4Z3G2_9ACTN|nr:DHA2 family efflux MFS transporter permease subunit [Nocardioides soli]MBB3043831.1 EmrB/QacA subfamily drug resistance transporter [Nocardioides soli]